MNIAPRAVGVSCKMSPAEAWIEVEAKKARTGEYPAASGASQEIYLAWIRECDARKCQSMLVHDRKDRKVDELLEIRALLFRGRIDEAETIIRKCAASSASPEERMEVLLEQARLAAFRGDWNLCHALSAKALDSGELQSLSYLSSLQVHALSCFEMGEFHAAVKALDLAESLASVYPFSISAHYANVLRARIAARDQSVRNGLSKIGELWRGLRKSPGDGPTADAVHAIVFGLADILKFAKLMHVSEDISAGKLEKSVLVSFHMTEAMGEQLYSALAGLDAAVCGPLEYRDWFFDRIAEERHKFKRIDALASEIFDSKELSCTSSANLAALRETRHEVLREPKQPASVSHVVLTEHEWAFQLRPWKAIDLSKHPQILTGLQILSRGSLSKADFFKHVWGNARYTSRLHDSSIWYLLNRIKKITGASFRVRDGQIQENPEVISL